MPGPEAAQLQGLVHGTARQPAIYAETDAVGCVAGQSKRSGNDPTRREQQILNPRVGQGRDRDDSRSARDDAGTVPADVEPAEDRVGLAVVDDDPLPGRDPVHVDESGAL